MRRLCLGLGTILLVVAASAAVAQILSLLAEGAYVPVSLGSIWYGIHPNSLVGFQATIEKNLSPALWVPIQHLLIWPAWLVLGLPGIVLYLACRSRRRDFY